VAQMKLEEYRLRLVSPECNPSSEKVNAIFELNEDLSELLPYLNTSLKGFQYNHQAKILVLKRDGRVITIRPKEISITKLNDEREAKEVFESLKKEILKTERNKENIKPSYESRPIPSPGEILKLLPGKNCKECGKPTCKAFAWDIYRKLANIGDEKLELEKCKPLFSQEYKETLEELRKILGL